MAGVNNISIRVIKLIIVLLLIVIIAVSLISYALIKKAEKFSPPSKEYTVRQSELLPLEPGELSPTPDIRPKSLQDLGIEEIRYSDTDRRLELTGLLIEEPIPIRGNRWQFILASTDKLSIRYAVTIYDDQVIFVRSTRDLGPNKLRGKRMTGNELVELMEVNATVKVKLLFPPQGTSIDDFTNQLNQFLDWISSSLTDAFAIDSQNIESVSLIY